MQPVDHPFQTHHPQSSMLQVHGISCVLQTFKCQIPATNRSSSVFHGSWKLTTTSQDSSYNHATLSMENIRTRRPTVRHSDDIAGSESHLLPYTRLASTKSTLHSPGLRVSDDEGLMTSGQTISTCSITYATQTACPPPLAPFTDAQT
jgi:hypothetical protein